MTRQEAFEILQKFEQNVAQYFVLDIMDVKKDARLGEQNINMLVRLLHDALPWPTDISSNPSGNEE